MKKIRSLILIILITFTSLVLFACQETPLEPKITLDRRQMTLVAGATSGNRITATLENISGTVTWQSTDEKVVQVEVTVNNKVATVKPISPGNAKIKAKIGDIETACDIIVTESEWILPDQETIGLEVGKTKKIEFTTNIVDGTATYQSDNETVAVVKDGLVTALAEGTANITIRIGTTTAKVIVKVEDAGVTTDYSGDVIILDLVDKKTFELTAISKGGVDISEGIWSVLDNTVVSISQSGAKVTITALESGVKKNTDVVFTVGDYSVSVRVSVKSVSLKLSFVESYVTIKANQNTGKLDVVLTPAQTGDDAKVEFVPSKTGVVTIAADGTMTRVAGFDFEYKESVTITVRATSVIDPEAFATATVEIENPDKNSKYISTKEEFISVMTNGGNAAADITIKLLNNIDLGGHVFTTQVMNGASFRGVLDGNGYTVSNFTAPSFFMHLYGTVKNIGFVANMSGENQGFLVQQVSQNGSVIENCSFDITFNSGLNYAAAIGLNNQGTVRNCIIQTTNLSSSTNIYADFVQPTNVGVTSVYYYNKGTNSVKSQNQIGKDLSFFHNAANFASWSKTIWTITNGAIPKLKNS